MTNPIQKVIDEIKEAAEITSDPTVESTLKGCARHLEKRLDPCHLLDPCYFMPSLSKWPGWANFCAIDQDGEVWFYEESPSYKSTVWDHPGMKKRFGKDEEAVQLIGAKNLIADKDRMERYEERSKGENDEKSS